jgi:hypothetical protein
MTLLAFVLLVSCCLLCWTRPYRPPQESFRRAEVIAIARVLPDTVCRYPLIGGARSYGVVLRVGEVLKGSVATSEIAAVLHYGLTPVVGGGPINDGCIAFDAGPRSEKVIEIYDTADGGAFEPFVLDAREDHLWCLGRHGDYWAYQGYPAAEFVNQLGVTEPDEVISLEKTALDRLLHEGDPDVVKPVVERVVAYLARRAT